MTTATYRTSRDCLWRQCYVTLLTAEIYPWHGVACSSCENVEFLEADAGFTRIPVPVRISVHERNLQITFLLGRGRIVEEDAEWWNFVRV